LEAEVLIVDAAAHPFVTDSDDLREYLDEPWKSRRLPHAAQREILRADFPWYLAGSEPSTGGLPGSDPAATRSALLDKGVDYVILVPLTRGMVPDIDREVAIASATNQWLAATWLGDQNADGRFKGSIRISPRSPSDAIEEIERWADHPHFVQVAVPLQMHAPYGQQQYFAIWEAAAKHGLPVAVHEDGGGLGLEYPPTPVGYPTYLIEAFAIRPFNLAIHVASLISEGVFDRLEDLVFVFADGGFDAANALLWRLDKDWKTVRSQIPWTQKSPSQYLDSNIRFVLHQSDGPTDNGAMAEALDIWGAARFLMFGSNYPYWDFLAPEWARDRLPTDLCDAIMGNTAARLYRLEPRPNP
jgi:uncharacterized protein